MIFFQYFDRFLQKHRNYHVNFFRIQSSSKTWQMFQFFWKEWQKSRGWYKRWYIESNGQIYYRLPIQGHRLTTCMQIKTMSTQCIWEKQKLALPRNDRYNWLWPLSKWFPHPPQSDSHKRLSCIFAEMWYIESFIYIPWSCLGSVQIKYCCSLSSNSPEHSEDRTPFTFSSKQAYEISSAQLDPHKWNVYAKAIK